MQFKADKKESQLFVKHIDLKYERNLWGRGKEHGLLLITETPLICVANKAEWNRWDALGSVRQVLSYSLAADQDKLVLIIMLSLTYHFHL